MISPDPQNELGQLDAYHRELASGDTAGQASSLRNGFLPSDTAVLIEAGIRCIPLIEADRIEITDAALDRLRAVIFKLRLKKEVAEVRTALERFDQVLAEKKAEDASNTKYGLLAIGGLLLILVALILFGVRWLTR